MWTKTRCLYSLPINMNPYRPLKSIMKRKVANSFQMIDLMSRVQASVLIDRKVQSGAKFSIAGYTWLLDACRRISTAVV